MRKNPETGGCALAHRFRCALERGGVTAAFLAYYVPASRQTVNNWRTGRHTVAEHNVPLVERLCAALELGIADKALPQPDVRDQHEAIKRLLNDIRLDINQKTN